MYQAFSVDYGAILSTVKGCVCQSRMTQTIAEDLTLLVTMLPMVQLTVSLANALTPVLPAPLWSRLKVAVFATITRLIPQTVVRSAKCAQPLQEALLSVRMDYALSLVPTTGSILALLA